MWIAEQSMLAEHSMLAEQRKLPGLNRQTTLTFLNNIEYH
jgi:hypothetical protein